MVDKMPPKEVDFRQLHLRIFLASPGDVANERTLARAVVDQLRYDSTWHGRVTLEVVAWDNPGAVAMLATATPQASVAYHLPKPSECDVVVVIFWSRVGTPLPPEFSKPDGTAYASGTEWEYLDAEQAAANTNRPRLLVYRRMEAPIFRATDEGIDENIRQFEWISQFFERFKNQDRSLKGGYNTYLTPDDFRRNFEQHLHGLIHEFTTSREFVPSVVLAHRTLPPPWKGSPFPGLRAFAPQDAPIFFGRGREIDELVALLEDHSKRFLTVIGASGSGKSSLVAAGLIPRLQGNALEGSREWRYLQFRPAEVEGDPLQALAKGLGRLLKKDQWPIEDVIAKLSAEPCRIGEIVDAVLADAPKAELLIFVDQFEELFSLVADTAREHFVFMLASAAICPRVRIIVTIRADFVARCIEVPQLAVLLRSGLYALPLANFDSLLEMITKPADRSSLFFDDGLPGRVLRDTGNDPGGLPLMAFALYPLYEKRELSGRLTHNAYESFGGVKGAIVTRAEMVFNSLVSEALHGVTISGEKRVVAVSDVDQTLSKMFRELVDVSEGLVLSRKRAPRSRLASTSLGSRLVDQFVTERLLVASEGADPFIEVAHEALLTNWPRLKPWIQGVLDDLRLRSQLQRTTLAWEQTSNPEYLWSDERCVDAYRRLRQLPYDPSESESRFLGPLDCRLMIEELDQSDTTPERRTLIGVRLALLGDPRPGVGLTEEGLPDICWCEVPGGRIPDREIEIAPFCISKYPITWAQYDSFVRAPEGYHDTRWWDELTPRAEQPGRQFQRFPNHPADNVSWLDATAFCRWLSTRFGYQVRLPTEWEWQQGANGGDHSKAYPWGEWAIGKANTYEVQLNRTTAVGIFRHGVSSVGADDMCGNVWEWCSDGSELYPPDDNCPLGYRAVRGGSWNFINTIARCNSRSGECRAYRFTSVGFRLARSNPNQVN
jgi:hypothetical protein